MTLAWWICWLGVQTTWHGATLLADQTPGTRPQVWLGTGLLLAILALILDLVQQFRFSS